MNQLDEKIAYDEKPLPSLRPAMYSHRIHEIQQAAKCAGYAIAIHGSMARDLDVVAIPWITAAGSHHELIARLCNQLRATVAPKSPTKKPHGRMAYTLLLGGALFMDLSVMPRTPAEKGQTDV